MTGYAPLFDSLTTGTLCGRWPDIGLWPIVLSMADKNGVLDVTPAYIAGVTGLPLEEVIRCMERFCQPDPGSRSRAEEGRRLTLVDPEARDWGWKVVNHAMYRERARLMAKNAREVASGENRKRIAETAAHRRSPPGTAVHPLSNANANANAESDKNSSRKTSKSITREMPEDLALSDSMREFALGRHPDLDIDTAFDQFKAHHLARGTKLKRFDMAWRTWVGNMGQFGYPKKNRPGEWI